MARKRTQADIISQLSNRELLWNVYLSQTLFLIISFIIGFFLFDSWSTFWSLWTFDHHELIYYGLIPGVIIVIVDIIMIRYLPARLYDDGGINRRLFTSISIPHIIVLTAFVALSEEILFRGVIQTHFGFWIASILFAIVHIRYLTKWVLLISVLLLSFVIGYIYHITDNLWTTVAAHFVIDLLLGLYYWKKMR
ncbi:membrane protease YdiL (CAAX protease family) [Alkalibacillus flavidus]|uniref:Membrane protease YdiL (CAAX protease family) n=1 Tax=Alkalibacillus flavidus TaxID=546021 RepID=A0ABV2KSK4_9BACI